jgi:putative Holliday junction resolvase
VRVGLSICDPDHIVVSPLPLLERQTPEHDAEFFKKLLKEEKITAIVLGLPIHLSGRESEKSQEARAFADWLRSFLTVPIYFWDERFSSYEADELMAQRKLSSKKRQVRRDSLAATVILRGFIEAGCPEDYEPRAIDEE